MLGTRGNNPLVCFGVNPSTARPEALDPTVRRVAGFARDNGFDSWVMLNIYPQIATDPMDMDLAHRESLKLKNERHIARVMADRPMTLLAAWGGLIETRPYLRPLLQDIVAGAKLAGSPWSSLGTLTKDGHPRHPLYVRAATELAPFDIDKYLRSVGGPPTFD